MPSCEQAASQVATQGDPADRGAKRRDSDAMTPERWRRVTSVLEEVLPCPAQEREARLRRLCGDDEDLRKEVESLLEFEEVSVTFLDEPLVERPAAIGTADLDRDEAEIGQRIGPYRVLGLLGRGGMGCVFLAQRVDEFRKRVALKRIRRSEQPLEEVLFRFENERQILADLDHPNIARILDGGTTEGGLPYFAMEYVEGLPIDRYCDEYRLTLGQRLELVLKVCGALQLAHENLVVHRDLKPGNVLVTHQGVPKLIDFGIAKHLEPASAPHDLTTEAGSSPMTPRYASPEQIRSGPITTASDIYSLGGMLYQLLSGLPPYPEAKNRLELMRAISESEPMAPSHAMARARATGQPALRSAKPSDGSGARHPENGASHSVEQHSAEEPTSSIGWARRLRPDQLQRRLAGDLDSIVLKAMRKQPRDRYRSMEQLADDLRRHLAGEPVRAHEGSFRYRAGKFVRRHRLALATAAAIVLSLTLSALAVVFSWRRAAEDEARFERGRAAAAERKSEILTGLLEIFDPNAMVNESKPFEILLRAQKEITEDLKAEPELLADLLDEPLAKIYDRLGKHDLARAAREEALLILRTLYSEDHPKTAEVLLNLGSSSFRLGDFEGAKRRSRQALEMRHRLGFGIAESLAALNNMASSLAQEGKLEQAAERYREVIFIQEMSETFDPSFPVNLRNLGKLQFVRGEHGEAEVHLRRALEIRLAETGPRALEVTPIRSTLGRVLQALGRLDEAIEQLDESLAVRSELLADDHPSVGRAARNLASVLLEVGDLDGAKILLSRAQSILTQEWEVAELDSLMGLYLLEIGDHEAAESCLRVSYHALEETRGLEVIYTRQALARLIHFYAISGDPLQAARYRAISRR
ncbi:MAG: serine/threonine-protein kinase [Acidobacteriota bacterium]